MPTKEKLLLKNLPIQLKQLREKKQTFATRSSRKNKRQQSTYNNYETGKSLPNIKEIVNLADLFQINVAELIGEKSHFFIQENQNGANANNTANSITINEVSHEELKKIIEQKDKIIEQQEKIITLLQQNTLSNKSKK